MSTILASNPFSVPNASSLLGEIVWWEFPTGTVITRRRIESALATEGFDPKLARGLCARHAFIRACRNRAQSRLVEITYEDDSSVTVQFTREVKVGKRIDYTFEALVSLDKPTDVVTCQDANLQAELTQELARSREERKTNDLTRLLQGLFHANADLFSAKGGTYLVPAIHAAFIDRVERFVALLGGDLKRLPVSGGTTAGNSTMQTIVVDSTLELLGEYEAHIRGITCESSKTKVRHAWQNLGSVYDRLDRLANLIGTERTRLEDQLRWLENLLRDQQLTTRPVAPTTDTEDDGEENDPPTPSAAAVVTANGFAFTF
jgi:hypothetical protein